MRYFKQFDLDKSIITELQNWAKANMHTDDRPLVKLNDLGGDCTRFEQECPLFKKWVDEKNLEIRLVIGIKVYAHNEQEATQKPHTDLDEVGSEYALNVPVENCEGTYTAQFDIVNGKQYTAYLEDEEKTKYMVYSDDIELKEVTRFYLTKATWFNTLVPHQVVNPTDKTRLSLSIRFKKNPSLD